MKKVNKKYAAIMQEVDVAVGRKEVVRLLKKAAKLKSTYDENLVAWDFIWKLEKKVNRELNR